MSDPFSSDPALDHAAPSRLRRHGAGWLGLWLGIIMAMALAVIISAQLYQDRGNARTQAEEAAVNLTNAIARDISRHIDLFRFVLSSLRETVQSDAFDRLPADLHDTVLFSHTAAPKALGVLFVTDANGIITAESGHNDIKGQSRGWRPYFSYHRDHDDDAMLVSGPLVSATSGDPVVVLSMRLNNPDGSFRGMVVASMLLSYFDGLLTDLSLEPGASLSLLLDHGIVMARKPADPDAIGRDLRQDPLVAAAGGKPQAIYVEPASIGGDRLIVSTAVEGSTMRVQMTQSLSQIWTHWRAKAWTIGVTTAVLILGIIALIVLFHRESGRRARAQQALALANATLERMATTDALTGIANRRLFDDILRREEAKSARTALEAAVLMIDIDLFKSFNDTYGHSAGDATLRSVAQAVARAVTRGGDLVARIGGEEFAVLLTETDLSGARIVAERVRTEVAALGIRHTGSPHGHVTVSIGLATSMTDTTALNLEEALNHADQALYDAKKNGRNRVEVAAPTIVAA
ncbi:sensor domain-containing diguanylate cyclase [Niveispirillum sp.]|uniref:sensor domain-containing diguanylate cyclase n=1 Tax=Niveispirillum sp. TaxID=1917217 RepID=UPI001B48A6C7|nr:sensor domain-containing diguanylate cyclase [Niveispirillum sp.]MBP7339897.1 GGDEF domain-containing protein [Niveispirillum sp.]